MSHSPDIHAMKIYNSKVIYNKQSIDQIYPAKIIYLKKIKTRDTVLYISIWMRDLVQFISVFMRNSTGGQVIPI